MLKIIDIDFEKLLESRERCVAILRPQNELFQPGQDIILSDEGSYTIPGFKGVYWKKLPNGNETQAHPPVGYEVATVYKEKIEKLESHLAYMLFGVNAVTVKQSFKKKYPQSDYFQIVILKRKN